MSPAEICRTIREAGVTLRLDGDSLALKPAQLLNTELLELIKANKPEIVDFLLEAHSTASSLMAAAMAACDHYGDGEVAREQMREDITNTPAHLRPELLAHFRQAYGGRGK